MYAKVALQRTGHNNTLSVPNEAIGNSKGQSFIYIVGADNKTKKVEVKAGISDAKYTEIISGDIKPTDNIVIKGKEFCSNGAVVNPKSITTK